MKRLNVSIIAVLAVASLLWSQPPQPVYEWYPLGPEKSAVNCILGDDTAMLLTGTDNGVMVRFDNKWHQATSGLPVHALARISKDRVAAAVGKGSKSDGILIGNKIWGPPYYQFSLLCWMVKPEALLASGSGDTLYAGGGNTLYRCVLPKQSDPAAFKPELIGLPEYAFGVEMPSCRALELFFGRLVAGGYDRSPMPGPGHLLYNNGKDSMLVERTMNVSAMTSINTGGVVGQTLLAVGTPDSGIYVGRVVGPTMPPVQPWKRFDGPGNEPILAILPAYDMKAEGLGMPVVAVKSGVFIGSISNAKWSEIGSIPEAPLCLAFHGKGDADYTRLSYLAGTGNGVYRYGLLSSTGIQTAGDNGRAAAVSLRVIATGGEPRLAFIAPRAGRADIAVNGVSGRLVCKRAVLVKAGVNSIALSTGAPGRGIYIISVRGEGLSPVIHTVMFGK